MKYLLHFFIDNQKFTFILSLGLLLYGLQGILQMNSESYPKVDFAIATVTTFYRGASIDDIEAKITKPLEDEIRKVSGLKNVKSISQSGLSTIVVEGDIDNVDTSVFMNDLQKAVDRAKGLPVDLDEKPLLEEIKSEEFPIVLMAIVGPNENRERDKFAEQLEESILDNENVKDLALIGYHEREFTILLDHQKMLFYHIGINNVINIIRNTNLNIPGGSIENDGRQYNLKIEGEMESIEELKRLPIRSNLSGKKIFLEDIADIEDGKRETTVKTFYNGQEATLLIISKKAGADIITTTKDIHDRVESITNNHTGEQKVFFYREEADIVKNKLDALKTNALSGFLLVVIILFVFFPINISLAASLSLPLALMGAFGMMNTFGVTLNAMTILSLVIVLGMLVDNSVVISENSVRFMREGRSPRDAVVQSILHLWSPMTVTSLTTVAAFLPMLITTGVMGQFIKWIPIIVTISLLFGLAESFFFLPTRLMFFRKKDSSSTFSSRFQKIENLFEQFVLQCVRKRYIVFISLIAILAFFLVILFVFNKFILFPPAQVEIYTARVETRPGNPLDATSRSMERLSLDIKEKLGDKVLHITARSGMAKMGPNDPKAKIGDRFGMVEIVVNEETRDYTPYTDILESLYSIDYSDYAKSIEFEPLVGGPPVGSDIEGIFRSNNRQNLNDLVEKIRQDLALVDGIRDLQTDDITGDDEIFVEIDNEKINSLGLSVAGIGQAISAFINGRDLSEVTIGNKNIRFHLKSQRVFKESTHILNEFTVADTKGNLVPLGKIATIKIRSGTTMMKRSDFKPSKTLLGNIDETKITIAEANKKLNDIFESYRGEYPDVSILLGGVTENTEESLTSLRNAFTISILAIFALLVLLFGSYMRPIIIITTIPLGLVGLSSAFLLHQKPISFLALIGIVGLGGIIVNSGIILISFIDRFKAETKLSFEEVLAQASRIRLKAVIVTSLTTIGGLVPTAYGIGGSDPMLIPMTLAMAWGLSTGTLLTLIWVPCAYAITEDLLTIIKRLFLPKRC